MARHPSRRGLLVSERSGRIPRLLGHRGYVYRGSEIKGLAGWHLFGDWCTGAVFGIPSGVTALTPPRTLLPTDAAITAFGEHAAGEMYLADRRGGIYRIVAGG